MPPRLTRAHVSSAPKTAKAKSKKRSLDAYSQAQKLVPEQRIARHRLGEVEDDGSRQKRRRRDSDADDDDRDDDEPQRKRPTQRKDTEYVQYGSDSEGNEWTMGGLAEDAEDSDLDSDEAFGESDEEKFESFTFRGSSRSKTNGKKVPRRKQASDMDLDETPQSEDDSGDSQDEEGLGLGDDAIDLAAMLDQDDEEDTIVDKRRRPDDSGSEEDDDESEESEDDDDDDDSNDEEHAARFQDFLEGIDASSAKQKPEPALAQDVDFDDFMEGTSLATENSKSKRKQKAMVPISAPLPRRQQEQINREIAAEKAKEQLDRWRDTVVRNRRAEFLNFPLANPDDQGVTVGKEKFVAASLQAPANELEERIQRIMEESGLAAKQAGQGANDVEDEEDALLKAEELAEKQLPVEEVMRRRAELRQTRELLFREEIKAKRIAKIKSKSYRRVHRRERERLAEQEKQAMEGLGYEDEDDKEKHDRNRAQARMSTRHKDSKWAKSVKQTNRGAWDDETRDGVIEQARRNEELKKRMAGHDVSGDEDSDDSDDSDEGVTAQQLDALSKGGVERNGLAGLQFMRNAEERKRKQNDEDVERLRKEMARADGDEDEDSEIDDQGLGRAIFGPADKASKKSGKEKKLEFEAPVDSDDEHEELENDETNPIMGGPTAKVEPKSILKKSTTASGPLAKGLANSVESSDKTKSTANGWLVATKDKTRKKADVDAHVDLDLSTITNASESKKSKATKTTAEDSQTNGKAGNTNGWTKVSFKTDDAEDSDSDEPTNGILSAQEQKQSLQQRAFAGDDVTAAFEAEKADLAADEDEKEVSNHLPGWGSWAGDGLSKSIKRANKRAAHNPLFKTKLPGVKALDRKDAKLDKVIVSEKSDRKGKKYLASVLPHEFETKEQYERSRRLPMGPEWTTKEVHQRMTRPRVVVKPGVRIEALERPTV